MSRRRTQPKPVEGGGAGYPTWEEVGRGRPRDPSRRRFLRQLTVGGALCLSGLPSLSHGQSLLVDFRVLERHPRPDSASNDALPGRRTKRSKVGSSEPEAAVGDALAQRFYRIEGPDEVPDGADTAPTDGPPVAPDPPDPPPRVRAAEELVTENRALWVDPGFLVLLEWTRPADDDQPVAALEGAADAVATLLGERVSSVDDLHNLDRLHPLEFEILRLLRGLVEPATIGVLHLDHDCRVVCDILDPSRSYPQTPMVDGLMMAPEWE